MRRAFLALGLTAAQGLPASAQDTVAIARHTLALDVSRLQPYRRAFDMVVQTRDTAVVIGQREVTLAPAGYAGALAWLLVETRAGVVPAAESLYVAPDMRPLHWSSALGAARLGVEFTADSMYGATSAPDGRRSIVLSVRPDLLVSTAMIEMLLPLLPLSAQWSDSVALLAVDVASSTVIPGELAVIGEEEIVVDSAATRPFWVVALRVDTRNVLFWVDKHSGEVRRVQQQLPAHAGSLLEFRWRSDPAVPPLE